MVIAKWTGCFPTLCYGEWKLTVDGVDYSHLIPEDKRHSPMETYGVYQSWHFENWSEVFESYEDGLGFEDWLDENLWVYDLPAYPEEVYEAFQVNDWRHNSCGGCI